MAAIAYGGMEKIFVSQNTGITATASVGAGDDKVWTTVFCHCL